MTDRRTISAPHPIDLARTLFPLRRGTGDPTMRIASGEAVCALRTDCGPATLRVRSLGDVIESEAWGPGARQALEGAPGLVGAEDDDAGFHPGAAGRHGRHGPVADAWRRHRGVRISRSGGVVRALVPAILEQKVAGVEARRAYRLMCHALGEPAPGPFGLLLPPDPDRVASLPYFAFHPWGVERRRAELIRAVCARAGRIEDAAEDAAGGGTHVLEDLLLGFRGIGPWTVAEVRRIALGDADAVSVGDFHLPHLVAWTLAGEPRGTDDRMLELLEPYRGHRARVQRLLETAYRRAPAFGPRMPVSRIASL